MMKRSLSINACLARRIRGASEELSPLEMSTMHCVVIPGLSARRDARSAYNTADPLLGLSRARSIEKSDISRITSDKKLGMGLAPSAVRHRASTEAAPSQHQVCHRAKPPNPL